MSNPWDRYRFAIDMGDSTYLRVPQQPDPFKSGSKAEKLAYCQRQIDRLVRWAKEDPDNEAFVKAGAQWLDMKKFVMEGRA